MHLKPSLKIFVCEFITAGGLNRVDLPASFAFEGMMMRDALLKDLSMLPNIKVITTHDSRLSPPLIDSVPISAQDEVYIIWQNLLQSCDVAFIIAPETNRQLTDLVALVNRCQVLHLGASLDAIKVASSKYQTSLQLAKASINVVPTYTMDEWSDKGIENQAGWVLKPDDGAGCASTVYFKNRVDVEQYLTHQASTRVIQPYILGIPASISMLCKNGKAWILSCNLQKIELADMQFIYRGSIVNGLLANTARFAKISTQIAQAIPGLAGYIGVDVLVSDDVVTILEINPRLTTSFVGLHQSLGINPSKLILDLFLEENFKMPLFNFVNSPVVEITV